MNWHECADILKKGEDEDQDSDEGTDHVFSLTDLERLPVHVVKIDQQNDKIADMVQTVADTLKIPLDRVNIMLRNEFSYNDYLRVEYFNMDWALEKKFETILKTNKNKFDHGTVLYVEDNDQKTLLEKFDWYKAMMNSKDLYKLHINLTALQPDNKECTLVVQVPKTATLRRLKDKISKKIGVPASDFGLKRNYVTSELKDLDHTMLQHGITN